MTQTREVWIDKLLEFNLDLAYNDGEFGNGLLHDLLRDGFKGFDSMTDEELAQQVYDQLAHLYEENEAAAWKRKPLH